MTAGHEAAAPGQAGTITVERGERLAVCCSGGGIRSATFNLGVLQALQTAEIFAAVDTVTAVSGGSYVAAAHALVTANPAAPADRPAPPGQPLAPPKAYALRSPEELHLRDHTRYLLESWQVAVRAVAVLVRGVLVNAILVGSVLFVTAHLAGWLLGAHQVAVLAGLRTRVPVARLHWYWLIPAIAAALTVVLAWLHALPPEQLSGPPDARRSARSAVARWLRGRGRARRNLRRVRLLLREHPSRPSNQALVFTLLTAGLLVAAPLALRGLYSVSLGSSDWSVITRFLGFANAQACQAAANVAQGSHHVCGAVARAPAAVRRNGAGAGTWDVVLATFGSLGAAVVALARATLGRLRTYRADLSQSGPVAGVAARAASFLQRRLVPWIGSALIVGIIILLSLRWIGDGASRSPLAGGWTSQGVSCLYAVAAFLLVKMLTDINSTSMHGFYRDRLAAAYGVVRRPPGPAVAAGADPAAGVTDAPWALLSMLAGTGPTLVICAAANCTDGGGLPPGRGSVSFTFTPQDIGLSREERAACVASRTGDRAPTTAYEHAIRLTLFDAVAVSGAAISPVMGKMTRPSMRILLAAADVRLGVWLPSPRAVTGGAGRRPARPGRSPARLAARAGAALAYRVRQPDLRHLWAEAAGSLHLDGRWLYVTDGGHYENLGLVEALRRRPDHLIVIDAAGDAPGQFATLGQAIALARSEVGVQVDIDPAGLLPDPATRQCKEPYVLGSFRYPEEAGTHPPHHLVYLKLAVPAGAPWDVIAYQGSHGTFPTDSTLQQLYDDQEFEAYRALGYHCGLAALADIRY